MANPLKIYLADPHERVADYMTAMNALEMFPWAIAIELDPLRKPEGLLTVDDGTSRKQAPDTGTVLAAGRDYIDVAPGDRVALHPEAAAKVFSRFTAGGYDSGEGGTVYFLGVDSNDEHAPIRLDVGANIIAKFSPPSAELAATCTLPEVLSNTLQPLHDWALIRRRRVVEQRGEIALPENLIRYDQTARVIAAGPRAFKTKDGQWEGPVINVGDVVIYKALSINVDIEGGERYGFVGEPRDYALVRSSELYAKVAE